MQVQEYNGVSLAYMGDAVMSLLVRDMLLSKGLQRSDVMQKQSVMWVSAKAQAHFLHCLESEGFFSEKEWKIVLRGRNTHPKNKAKNADILTYRHATGLEAVFGWLYMKRDHARLQQLWQRIVEIGESR